MAADLRKHMAVFRLVRRQPSAAVRDIIRPLYRVTCASPWRRAAP